MLLKVRNPETGEFEVLTAAGVPGPPGAPALWTSMTQAEFNAIPAAEKDPATLYVIIG
jgi:hypothetical protein